jgi:hypothetical protein
MPTSAAVVFPDIESLVIHLGGWMLERRGSGSYWETS